MKISFAQILEASEAELRRKLFRKVPLWESVNGINIPGKLCTEQCSSQSTAFYKAEVAERIAGHGSILTDLTGGLGVDSWAFARQGFKVRYNEMDPALARAAAANFKLLGFESISVTSEQIDESNAIKLLTDSGIVYLDPARRDASGRKVFLLEDCSPDILKLKDGIFKCSRFIMVKLSPMADISMVCRQLGSCVREVHVIGTERECKELLVLMDREWQSGYTITVTENGETFFFTPEEESEAGISLIQSPSSLRGMKLYEPGPAMLKAGAYKLLCSRKGLFKLGNHAHLYIGSEQGKIIREVLHFDGANIKDLGRRYPKCEITARNIPITSDELRKRMKVDGGGNIHIYAVGCDFSQSPSERLLIVTLNP